MSGPKSTKASIADVTTTSRHVYLTDEHGGQSMDRKDLAKRPGFNGTGKEIITAVNLYAVTQFPTKSVYQYDVQVAGTDKRVVIQKVWNSKTRKAVVGNEFIFDGNKLAWSLVPINKEVNVMVDLDAEQGRSDSKIPNTFRLVVRQTKTVNLKALHAYLSGTCTASPEVFEAINFLDHVLRETPSSRFIPMRRSFFSPDNPKAPVGGGVYAYKGIYQAIRTVHPGKLAVNIDVSNSCFWAQISLTSAAIEVLGLRDIQHLTAVTKPVDDGLGGRASSQKFQQLSRFHKVAVKASYKGCPVPDKEWIIKGFLLANSKEYTIETLDAATGKMRSKTIFDYFKTRYNVALTYWELPLVKMTKKGVVYPMEFLGIHKPQKFPFKLDELQTTSMIKFAVTRPAERRKAVEESKRILAHGGDRVLQAYGLRISDSMMVTKARLLPNPEIVFGGNQRVNPGTSGRWDLRGKKFYNKNSKPLTSWGVGIFPGRYVNQQDVERFVDTFVRAYQGHGGTIATTRPFIGVVDKDPAEAVYKLFHNTGNKFNLRPELLIFVVSEKNAFHYSRIKKSCDCRFGVPSQVLQATQVVKCNGQYISNVLMKVNAKLGGTTARVSSKITKGLLPFTMIIGADVSHSAPGSPAPSMAAVSVSMDQFGGRYAGACQTNGDHVEMISEANVESMLTPLFKAWYTSVGQGRVPQNIYYFRDGVSEGQFQYVLNEEIPSIRKAWKNLNRGVEWNGKITVVVASKRHHIRAFPNPNDRNASNRNGNPLPGTLIDKDITGPNGWDFFLWSHIALQGTSRPVHYHVLIDEMNHSPKDLQNMIYEHCYQYMRSTISVSLFPAVYYAHLVSNRARSHENVPTSSGPRSGPDVKQGQKPSPSEPPKSEGRPLLPMAAGGDLALKMWYI
ncbi:hypothetical protein PABG_02302 [Paracoccidioides brasiliensis Pb03]|nr:hypothetical protein PABG_02302 [Paracoccidioides brasiliensis Pb03]